MGQINMNADRGKQAAKSEIRVELLSPAGSPDAFYGAINAGADAVYLAGNRFGARAYADNFSDEELVECLRYAHLLGKKVYLTVNTLVKESELAELPAFMEPLVKEKLDGVIVQDFGVLKLLHECFPDLPLHASTQMNVTGSYGARLLKRYGVVRVVPARELSLKEIAGLISESQMEVECFIHGAMCYSYSGQCLFSSILGGRSGNRGRCAQPCRLPYAVFQDDVELAKGKSAHAGEIYPLSLKDMCTLEILPELIAAGICSFKIEGRMKKAEYAAGVTAIYRKYLDLYLCGKWEKPSKEDLAKLQSLYIRSGLGEGYYHCKNGKNMVTIQSPSYSGSEEEQLREIQDRYLKEKKKVPVTMKAVFRLGKEASVEVFALGKSFSAKGSMVEAAAKSPVTRENIAKQLTKLGDSPFFLEKEEKKEGLTIEMDEGIFYSLKLLNDLRRQAIDGLTEVILHE